MAGFSIGEGVLSFGQQFGIDIAYVDIYVDDFATRLLTKLFFSPSLAQQTTWALSNQAAKSMLQVAAIGKFSPSPSSAQLVTLADEQFVVATTDDLTRREDIVAPASKGEAYRALAAHLAANPAEQGQLQVVPLYELAA